MSTPQRLGLSEGSVRFDSLELTNFLSYRRATIEFGDLTALVGPNSSGKSNAVAALKLLREIPIYGLSVAISRRGGFDQLRRRSAGRPYDPELRLNFRLSPDLPASHYTLALRSKSGRRYEVKHEEAHVYFENDESSFTRTGTAVRRWERVEGAETHSERDLHVDPGQSAIQLSPSLSAIAVSAMLTSVLSVEIDLARVRELQDPSPTEEYEPDGSNVFSILENFGPDRRRQLVDYVRAIVPTIERFEVRHLADKVSADFFQSTGRAGTREFSAKQMSDGTLRTFAIFVAMLRDPQPALLVVEEPEVAIHPGALQTLIEILKDYAKDCQVVVTTHSADIVDDLDVDDIRVVWAEDGESHISAIAEHARKPVIEGLMTPGALLRADALDPESA